MKRFYLIVLTIILSSFIPTLGIQPPNPDACLECDSVPWMKGTFSYEYVNGTDTCLITVGYGYRYCNGKIECYIDRLFYPSHSCYTNYRFQIGFYEYAENQLTIYLAGIIGMSNNSSLDFYHWRPSSCSFLCYWYDINTGEFSSEIMSCSDEIACCLQRIEATRNSTGKITTDFVPPTITNCPIDINTHCGGDHAGPCFIECR